MTGYFPSTGEVYQAFEDCVHYVFQDDEIKEAINDPDNPANFATLVDVINKIAANVWVRQPANRFTERIVSCVDDFVMANQGRIDVFVEGYLIAQNALSV